MKSIKFLIASTLLVTAAGCGDDNAAAVKPDAKQQDTADAAVDAPPDAPAGKLVINEVEGVGAPTDWIEIFNGTNATIDLSTYYLADSGMVPEVLTGTIAAGEHRVLAQGDAGVAGTDVTFKLNKDADAVYLYSDNGVTLVDSIDWAVGDYFTTDGVTFGTTSYGRSPDGTGVFAEMALSKGATNTAPL